MRYLLPVCLVVTFVGILPSLSTAFDDPYNQQPYVNSGQPNYRYKSYTGKEYQYDLSRPQDQLRYDLDLGAQMRDELNVDPRIELDRGLGQYGGGAKH
jgi:hypothetical protein